MSTTFARNIQHQTRFGGVECEGLFAEHVLTRTQSAHNPFTMLNVRQIDIHGIDLDVVEKMLVCVVHTYGFESC
jgi:hypothetical protein